MSGRGEIPLADLSQVLRELIPTWTENNLRAFMQAVDKNGDGRIQYQEFAAWLMRSNDGLDEARRVVMSEQSKAAQPTAAPTPTSSAAAANRPRQPPFSEQRPLMMQGKSLWAR